VPQALIAGESGKSPTGVWLEQDDGRPTALLIEAENGAQTIVRFHERAGLGGGTDAKTALPSER